MVVPPTVVGVRLLLLGAGHAHLHVLRRSPELVRAGYEVHLVAPPTFAYSGMASAVAWGALPAGANVVDVAELVERLPVTHHVASAIGSDAAGHIVLADRSASLGWDVLSVNVGSIASDESMSVDAATVRVKPLENLNALPNLPDRSNITIVGGGHSGLEVAGHLAAQSRGHRVLVLEAGPRMSPQLPHGAGRSIERRLAGRGVTWRTGCTAVEIGARSIRTQSGEVVPHDLAVLAAGLTAPPLGAALGLGDAEGIPVRATLQHSDRDDVYAAGDCAAFLHRPLPRLGVHGVRQGPVLVRSLLARAGGRELPTYRPQRHALQVIDLGGGTGLATRGRWWFSGRLALRLKRWIDARWLRGLTTTP